MAFFNISSASCSYVKKKAKLNVSVKYNTPKYKKYQARRGESDTFIVFKFDAYVVPMFP